MKKVFPTILGLVPVWPAQIILNPIHRIVRLFKKMMIMEKSKHSKSEFVCEGIQLKKNSQNKCNLQ